MHFTLDQLTHHVATQPFQQVTHGVHLGRQCLAAAAAAAAAAAGRTLGPAAMLVCFGLRGLEFKEVSIE